MLLNCGVRADSWESLGLQGDPTSQSSRKSVLNTHWKDCCWSWNSNTLATWCEELTHWKRRWCWERLKQEEKGTTEDEMVGWHHRLEGHEFEQAPRVGDRQVSLACYSPWGHKKSDTTELLNWTETTQIYKLHKTSLGPAWGQEAFSVSHSLNCFKVWRLRDFTFTFHFHALERQPTPVFLPGESQGRGSLVGCRLCGHTELDMTEAT